MREIMCMEKHMRIVHLKSMHVWFPEDEYHCQEKCDLIRFYGSRSIHENCCQSLAQKTIIIDLTQPADVIYADFKRQHRQQIKKSETDGLETRILDSSSIMDDIDVLDDFARMYHRMYHDKGIDRYLDVEILKQYINNHILWITSIIYEGEPIVYHTLASDRQTVRAMQSCSLFREKDPQIQQIIGRANKKLHWDEMQYFKELGAVSYDFGGIFSDVSTDPGINQFKSGFGGECADCYREIAACSSRARIYLLISRALSKNTI
jgi:hypothetical protein